MKMINKKGFTLAEVLITLGIIGVVAALTIPTLVQNYQTKSWATASQVFEAKFTEGGCIFQLTSFLHLRRELLLCRGMHG